MAVQDIKNKVVSYLQNDKGYWDNQDLDKTPALLFVRSTNDAKFGDIYLFGKFGQCNNNTINVKSEITSHYVETNTSRQDHWALPPKTYTISGLIGEVIYTPPTTWSDFVDDNVAKYLTPLTVLSPTINNYTQTALNLTEQIEATAIRYGNMAKKIFSTFLCELWRILTNFARFENR